MKKKKTKVLLIHVPEDCRNLGRRIRFEPVGLESLSAFLMVHGYESKVIDMHVQDYSVQQLLDECKNEKYDLIGFSIFYSNITKSLSIAEELKRSNSCRIVFGGYFASIKPEIVLNEPVDFLVVGEGEDTLLELTGHLERGDQQFEKIDGLVFKRSNAMVVNAPRKRIRDLDSLPFPDRRFIQLNKYCFLPGSPFRMKDFRMASIASSRGCKFNCGFCTCPLFWQHQWVGRSPESILSEMKDLKENHQIRQVFFAEEDFCADKKRVMRLSELMIQEKMDLSWICATCIDNLDEELIDKMADAGCRVIFVGFESGSPAILKKLNKNFDLDRMRKVVHQIQKRNIYVGGTFIVGLPWESKETIKETLSFMKSVDLNLYITNYYKPIPGTPFFRLAVQKNLFDEDAVKHKDKYYPYVKTLFLSLSDVTDGMKKMCLHPILRPSYFVFLLRFLVKNPKAFEGYFEIVRVLFKYVMIHIYKTVRRQLNLK